MKRGDFPTAYKHYTWLGKHTDAPDSASFNLEMGNICLALQHFDEALPYLKNAIIKTKGQKGTYSALGLAYLKLGKIPEAKDFFTQELEKNPTDPLANFHMGDLAFKDKQYSEAMAYFSRVAYLPGYKETLKPYWNTIEKEVLTR